MCGFVSRFKQNRNVCVGPYHKVTRESSANLVGVMREWTGDLI